MSLTLYDCMTLYMYYRTTCSTIDAMNDIVCTIDVMALYVHTSTRIDMLRSPLNGSRHLIKYQSELLSKKSLQLQLPGVPAPARGRGTTRHIQY